MQSEDGGPSPIAEEETGATTDTNGAPISAGIDDKDMQKSAAGLLLGKLLLLLSMSIIVGITANCLGLSLLVDRPTVFIPSFKNSMSHSAALHVATVLVLCR